MRKSKRYRKWTTVEVHWTDIYSIYGDSLIDSLDEYTPLIRKSLGFVLLDAPDRLVIVMTDDRTTAMATDFADALVIPRGVVRKVIRLGPVPRAEVN